MADGVDDDRPLSSQHLVDRSVVATPQPAQPTQRSSEGGVLGMIDHRLPQVKAVLAARVAQARPAVQMGPGSEQVGATHSWEMIYRIGRKALLRSMTSDQELQINNNSDNSDQQLQEQRTSDQILTNNTLLINDNSDQQFQITNSTINDGVESDTADFSI
jgi:hypothetical protein